MDGRKGLAMWIGLQKEEPLGKIRNTRKRAVPVTRNPTKAQFQPSLIEFLAGFSLNHQSYWKLNTFFPINYCSSLLLVLLLVLAGCDTNQNRICHRWKPADLCSFLYPFCIMQYWITVFVLFLHIGKHLRGAVTWRTLHVLVQVSISLRLTQQAEWGLTFFFFFFFKQHLSGNQKPDDFFFSSTEGLPWLCGQSSKWWMIIRGLLLEKKSPG